MSYSDVLWRCGWSVLKTERTTRRPGENKALISWSARCASWLICHNIQTVECFHRFYHVRVWVLVRLPSDLHWFHPMRERVSANGPIRSRARANMVEPQIASRRDSLRVWWSNPSVNLSLTALLCGSLTQSGNIWWRKMERQDEGGWQGGWVMEERRRTN